jgi:hypothetical protein
MASRQVSESASSAKKQKARERLASLFSAYFQHSKTVWVKRQVLSQQRLRWSYAFPLLAVKDGDEVGAAACEAGMVLARSATAVMRIQASECSGGRC